MEQKEIKFEKKTKDELKAEGLPTFNDCNHYYADMSHMNAEGNATDWMNTIVVKLPNGNHVTMCVMQTSSQKESCIDVMYHGENITTKAMGFTNGRTESIKDSNLYAVICNQVEGK